MSRYRHRLPQLSHTLFLTDGGLETTLIFHNKRDLPLFAAFDLLRDEDGLAELRAYYAAYAALARSQGTGFILESPTWRASADWGAKLGYSAEALAEANRAAIELMEEIRAAYETGSTPMVVSGCVGPRGDGYDPGLTMSAAEAEAYHAAQIGVFRDAGADMITAITMNYEEEAVGIARAAIAAEMPVAISFTVETDGRLPTGQMLKDAIEAVDRKAGGRVAYYMINCAHPTHFPTTLGAGEPWTRRIRGIRANASKCSHAELDAAPELDDGDPDELGRQYRELRRTLPGLTVLGGCCGTDFRHVERICLSCQEAEAA